jgi:site-specific DNA recombinase
MPKRSTRQYLKTHRRFWALSQRELGKLTGLTRQAISHYEQQMMRPSFEVALRLEIIFGKTPGHLFPALYERVEEEVMREAAALREDLDVAIRAQLGKPIGGAAPFGYQWKDKQLVPDPKEAPIRVLLHELFVEHQRKKTVARILNERGYRTRNGSEFSDTTISRLLEDTTAKGLHRANYTRTDDRSKSWELKPESEWVYTPVEPILSEELWDTCARILDAQKARAQPPTKRATHLFAGFAYCACGQKMYVRAKSPKYVCEGCRNKIPVDDLEAVFREQLRYFLISPAEVAAHTRAAEDAMREKERLIESAEAERKRIDAQADSLIDLYQAGQLSKEDFGRRHQPLSERRAQLEEELPRLEASLDVLRISAFSREEAASEVRSLTDRWGELPQDEKRQMVEAITDRITIGREDVEIALLHLPLRGNEDHRATRPQGFMAATSCTRAG